VQSLGGRWRAAGAHGAHAGVVMDTERVGRLALILPSGMLGVGRDTVRAELTAMLSDAFALLGDEVMWLRRDDVTGTEVLHVECDVMRAAAP
jgi:hypothetical protein